MLYGLIDYDYDYYKLIGYTEDLDEAYKYSAIKGCEIEPLERLKSDIDYSQYNLILADGTKYPKDGDISTGLKIPISDIYFSKNLSNESCSSISSLSQ